MDKLLTVAGFAIVAGIGTAVLDAKKPELGWTFNAPVINKPVHVRPGAMVTGVAAAFALATKSPAAAGVAIGGGVTESLSYANDYKHDLFANPGDVKQMDGAGDAGAVKGLPDAAAEPVAYPERTAESFFARLDEIDRRAAA